MGYSIYGGIGVSFADCRTIKLTAGAAKTAGDVEVTGDSIAIWHTDVANGDDGALIIYAPPPGVKVVKDAGTTWTPGQAIYWDATGENFTTAAGANTLAGIAAQAATSAATVGYLALNHFGGSTVNNSTQLLVFNAVLGTADDLYIPMPAGTVTRIDTVIDAALTTADETLTFKNNAGTGMTGGVVTITQSGSAAGDKDAVTPTANNTFAAGEAMICAVGGENGTAALCKILVTVKLS